MELVTGSGTAKMDNTRVGLEKACTMLREAGTVADRIGGTAGASRSAAVLDDLSHCLGRLGKTADAANVACSAVRAARASGDR